MDPAHREKDAGPIERRTLRLLARISDANRPLLALELTRRQNEGLKANSNRNWLQAMLHVDQALRGKPLAAATADDWIKALGDLGATVSESTRYNICSQVKACLRRFLNVERLPREIADALKVRVNHTRIHGRLLSDADLRRTLEAAPKMEDRQWRHEQTLELQAILWMLWDSGFRASELLSLNVGDVSFEDARGARISLREDAPLLKTGARSIYACEAVPPVRAWLVAHPASEDAKAPLFPGFRSKDGRERLQYSVLHKVVQRVGEISGINAASSRQKPLSLHDFRHTAATRRARAGWNEAQLCAHFGWAPGSKMAAHYVHLSAADLRAVVRRDAGIDDLGYVQAMNAGDDARALAELLKRLLHQAEKPVARTQRPADWEMP